MNLVSEDKRGQIYEIGVIDGQHVNILVTKAGFMRGGHFHDYPEEFYVLWGELHWTEAPTPVGNPGTVNNTQYAMGGLMKSQPGIPHMLYAITDSVVVEFRPEHTPFKATDYEPMRKLIREQLA